MIPTRDGRAPCTPYLYSDEPRRTIAHFDEPDALRYWPSTSDSINRRYNDLVKDGYIFVLQDIRGASVPKDSF